MTAPSLTAGDSVRERCMVCRGGARWLAGNSAWRCPKCNGAGFVYRRICDEQDDWESRTAIDGLVTACDELRSLQETLSRLAALARAVEDPTNSEPLRQLLAAIKEAANV